jgi:hypothetical protein
MISTGWERLRSGSVTTAKRDLDDALAIRPPRLTVIRRDLDRQHGAASDHRFLQTLATGLRQQLDLRLS